jgi:hypothetical protein
MRHKEKLLIIDTETCNSVLEPIPYDIGYIIADRSGHIYVKRSYVVAETFIDMKDVMKSAYYAEKIPQYWEDIKSGKRVLKTFWTVRKELLADMKKYNIKKVGAYNMGFDKRALNTLIRYLSKSWARWFFPFGTEFFCIWHMACDVLLNRNCYVDFALKNGLVSDAGNIKTSAESAYKFITNKIDFVENHTGLEDVKIEVAIMAECFKQHKKMSTEINSACWQKVQKKRKEIDCKAVFK